MNWFCWKWGREWKFGVQKNDHGQNVYIGWKKWAWKRQKKSFLHVCTLIVGKNNRIKSISMIALAIYILQCVIENEILFINSCEYTTNPLFFAMRTDVVFVRIKFCFDSFSFWAENHKSVLQFAAGAHFMKKNEIQLEKKTA